MRIVFYTVDHLLSHRPNQWAFNSQKACLRPLEWESIHILLLLYTVKKLTAIDHNLLRQLSKWRKHFWWPIFCGLFVLHCVSSYLFKDQNAWLTIITWCILEFREDLLSCPIILNNYWSKVDLHKTAIYHFYSLSCSSITSVDSIMEILIIKRCCR